MNTIVLNIFFNLAVLYMLVFGISLNELEDICQAVRDKDEHLCRLIRTPRPYNGKQVFPGIEAYITSFDKLRSCLASCTNQTLDVCQDIFDEQGANFMHIRFDRDDLINGFQWDEEAMDQYEKLRGDTLDAWLKCERYIYKHSSFEIFADS